MQKDIFIYKMSAVVKRALPLLETLVNANPKLKKAIIQYASPDLVTAISEIALNMLKGIIKLTPQQKQRLSRYKKEFRSLVKKTLSVKKKRKILVQKGTGAGLACYYLLHFHCLRGDETYGVDSRRTALTL